MAKRKRKSKADMMGKLNQQFARCVAVCGCLRALFVLVVFVVSFGVSGQEAAQVLPGNVSVYIEVRDVSGLLKDIEKDPLWTYLKDKLPARNQPAAWNALLDTMQMSERELIDKYFGTQIVVAAEKPGKGQPLVLMLKVKPADIALCVKRLELMPMKSRNGYKQYAAGDGQWLMAEKSGWMVLCDVKHRDFYERVVGFKSGRAQSLGQSLRFNSWVSRLHKGYTGFIYALEETDPKYGTHLLGLYRDGYDIDVRYVGRTKEFGEGLDMLEMREQLPAWIPLPEPLVAMSLFNAKTPIENPRSINAMIEPYTVENDLRPNLKGPMVGFVSASSDKDDPEVLRMTFGAGMHFEDEVVVKAINKALNKWILLLNVWASNLQFGKVVITEETYKGQSFYRMNIGDLLTNATKYERLKHLSLCFGQVGNWYLVCSDVGAFRSCVDSYELSKVGDVGGKKDDRAAPVMKAEVHGKLLYTVLKSELNSLQAHLQSGVQPGVEPINADDYGRIQVLLDVISHYKDVGIEVRRGEDRDEVVGNLYLRRDQRK